MFNMFKWLRYHLAKFSPYARLFWVLDALAFLFMCMLGLKTAFISICKALVYQEQPIYSSFFSSIYHWNAHFDSQCLSIIEQDLLKPCLFILCVIYALIDALKKHFKSYHYPYAITWMIATLCTLQIVKGIDASVFLLSLGKKVYSLLSYWHYFIGIGLILFIGHLFNHFFHPRLMLELSNQKRISFWVTWTKNMERFFKHDLFPLYIYTVTLGVVFSCFVLLFCFFPMANQDVFMQVFTVVGILTWTFMGLCLFFMVYARTPNHQFSFFVAIKKIVKPTLFNFRFKATLTASQAYASAFATPQHQHQTLFWMTSFSVSTLSSLVTYSLLHTHLPYWQILVYTMAGKALLFSLVLHFLNHRLHTPIQFKAWLPWLALGFVTSHTLPTAINTFKFLDTCILKLWGLHDLVRLGLKPLLASPFIANLYTWGQSLGVGITVDLLALTGILWCFWYRDMCYLAKATPIVHQEMRLQ
jgi:hypothetical protein